MQSLFGLLEGQEHAARLEVGDDENGEEEAAVQRNQPDSLRVRLLHCRELCRSFNACIARQPRDRVRGRFWITELVAEVVGHGNEDNLSDGNLVALALEESDGRGGTSRAIGIGLVEGLLVASACGKKRPWANTQQLSINEAEGRMKIRLLEAEDDPDAPQSGENCWEARIATVMRGVEQLCMC